VFKLFRSNSLVGMHSHNGYANFGFKAISANGQFIHKYGDRSLYNAISTDVSTGFSKSELQNGETQNLEVQASYRFALIHSFSVQKAGNEVTECEDIWYYTERDHQVSLALSDGATESSFAREWANELVTAFVHRHLQQDIQNEKSWLLVGQQTWQQWLAHQNLSWFAKRKAGEGAFATFLSLEIFDDCHWQSLAVGDSCLFVVRDRHLQNSFPLQNSSEFNHRPRLIGTYTDIENIRINQVKGIVQAGDRFYLTTDAIACWIFKQLETNQNPWLKLDELSSQELFADWVNKLRDRHEIANDDTTLLCLEVKMDSAKRCSL
jgi:hypothetical protein